MTNSGTSSTTGGTNSVATTRAVTNRAYDGLRIPSTYPPVTATTTCTSHEPIATLTVFQK